MSGESTSPCGRCGASVYREHLDSGIARYEGSTLLCPHCVTEHDKEASASNDFGGALEPIALEDDDKSSDHVSLDMSSSKVHGATEATLGSTGAWNDSKFARTINPDAPGASRCRTFHCKLSDGALNFLNSQINEWLDGSPGVSIKFATSTIGIFEGKHAEPNLILTMFY